MKKVLTLGAIALFTLVSSFAQEFRGSIIGSIADMTGAAVTGAKVTITEIHTGTKVETVSDSVGHYNAPFLLPGDYDVAVTMDNVKGEYRAVAGSGSVADSRICMAGRLVL